MVNPYVIRPADVNFPIALYAELHPKKSLPDWVEIGVRTELGKFYFTINEVSDGGPLVHNV
jgi:hypothetical protein